MNPKANNSTSDLCQESTFTRIFRDYSEDLFRYLFYKTGNENLAQDITQEAFLKMWKNCAEVIFATAKNYVFTIANNLMRNEFKHQKVVMRFRDKATEGKNLESPEYLMEEKEWKAKIETAIGNLPEKTTVSFPVEPN